MNSVIAAHKQVEQTLRYLTVITEQVDKGIVVFGLDGVIQFVNVAWAVMHGYKKQDELIGKQISVLHTKEQMKTDVIPFISEAKQRGRFAGRLGHARRDGTPFFTEMLMVVFNDEAGKAMGLIGFASDLTEQESMEDELRQYRCHMEELVKQQAKVLETAKSELQCQVKEYEQNEQKHKQEIAELSVANKELQEQLFEHKRARDELEQQIDKLEQRLREQSSKLTAATTRLQDEITKHEKQEEYLKQRTDAIKAACARLQAQIDELSAGGPVGESDMSRDSGKPAVSITDNEKTMLENVFRQNVVLQKPKLNSIAEEES